MKLIQYRDKENREEEKEESLKLLKYTEVAYFFIDKVGREIADEWRKFIKYDEWQDFSQKLVDKYTTKVLNELSKINASEEYKEIAKEIAESDIEDLVTMFTDQVEEEVEDALRGVDQSGYSGEYWLYRGLQEHGGYDEDYNGQRCAQFVNKNGSRLEGAKYTDKDIQVVVKDEPKWEDEDEQEF